MYSRTGAPEEPEGDDGTRQETKRETFPERNVFGLTNFIASFSPTASDLIDEILAKVDHETIDMSLWTMTELTDIVRHFDYILNDVEAYLLRKMDEMQGQKASDDMFDLDEDSGLRSSKGSFFLEFSHFAALFICIAFK